MPVVEYSSSNAKGRATIAALIESLVRNYRDAGCEIAEGYRPRETLVRITYGDAVVSIALDRLAATNGYVVPWNIRWGSDRRFSGAFERAAGASVNKSHRRKCTAVYATTGLLLEGLADTLDCIRDERAYIPEA